MTAEKIMGLHPNTALFILFGIGCVISIIFKNRKFIKESCDGFYNRRKKNEEYKEMLLDDHCKTESLEEKFDDLKGTVDELVTEMQKITKHVATYEQHREEDRAVSIQYRDKYDKQYEHTVQGFDKLTEALNMIGDKIDNMQEVTDKRFKDSEERNNQRIKTELKDKILRAYNVYHEKGQWNEMEREAFNDFIKEYEKVNGNSYVHSVIIPESYTWEVIPIGKD